MKKKIIIISLIFVLFLMSVGYSVYSGIFKINGTSNIDSNFLVEVTNIKEESKTGKAVSVTEPTYTKSTASFNAKLSRPGDNIEYEVTLSNNGTIDSKVNNIVITNPSSIIKVETRGISKGQILKSGENLKYIVRVYIDENSKITEDVTEKIEVSTDLIQDDNQIFNEGVDGDSSSKLEIKSISLTSSYTSITTSISAKGEGLKYYYSLDNENFVEGTSSYTFNNLEVNKRYTIYYKIEDSKNNYVTESRYINTKELDGSVITVENEEEWSTSKKVTISFPSVDGAKYYYKIGNNDYIETTSIKELTISENAIIYTKIEAGSSSIENKKEITKIDNETPELSLTTSYTSKSITVVANTSSISGINKYEFSSDGSTWIDNKTYNNYTFKDLTHNTSYTYYVRVTSNTNKMVTKSVTVKTTKIETPTFTESETDDGKEVTITFPEGCNTEYTCSYIKNSDEEVIVTEKTKKVTFTETGTGTIIAKVNDGKNYITSSTYTVKVDKSLLGKMSLTAVMDNAASTYVSSSGINFKNNNSDTNGKGVYTKSGTENDTYPVYYYRGDVTNNNVLFGNFCWKIVRSTSKGGVKLIYNGTPQTDDSGNFSSCNNTAADVQIAKTTVFNSNYTSLADVGYLYGTRYTSATKSMSSVTDAIVYGNDVTYSSGSYTLKDTTTATSWSSSRTSLAGKYHYTCLSTSSTCSSVYYITYFGNQYVMYYLTLSNGKDIEDAKNEMFSNTNKSTIKTAVDNWYGSNMTDYTSYLEDAEWCNDRSVYKGVLASKDIGDTSYSYFGAYQRMKETYSPSVTCPNENDKLSVSKINNSSLMPYPVGLLTIDEINMAGGSSSSNSSYYLYTGQNYWLLSPAVFYGSSSGSFLVNSTGSIHYSRLDTNSGIRPSIVLKQGMEVKSGTDGSYTNPYQITLN